MASQTLYTHISLDQTIGTLEIGSLFSVFLFGILTLQIYNYYHTFWDDGWKVKALVSPMLLFRSNSPQYLNKVTTILCASSSSTLDKRY